MRFGDQSYNLRIELDTEHCELAPAELEKMEQELGPLRKPVRDFPVSALYITVVFHRPSNAYRVRTSLVLPGRTLFTGDRDKAPLVAFGRCVRKLVRKIKAYKETIHNQAELTKHREGTQQKVVPTRQPDAQRLDRAVEAGDYMAFREATYVYEEPVRRRIGRWIKRYPRVEAQLGDRLSLADIVEEVFLNAFERYGDRPGAVRLGEWLQDLIDPSVRALLEDPDAEMENIRAVRSARETLSGEEQQA